MPSTVVAPLRAGAGSWLEKPQYGTDSQPPPLLSWVVRRQTAALWSQSQMDAEQLVVYFNNCHNRDHVALFGSGAFFDLGTTGRQGTQARDLQPGQPCVVAEWSPDKRIVFDWYSF